MSGIYLPKNSYLEFDCKILRLLPIQPKGDKHQFSDDETGEVSVFTAEELLEILYERGGRLFYSPKFAFESDENTRLLFEQYPERERKTALMRQDMVWRIEELLVEMPLSSALTQVVEENRRESDKLNPPKKRQLLRIYKRWVQAGNDILALIPHYLDRGSKQKRLHPEIEEMIQEVLDERYLCPEKASLTEIYKDIYDRILKRNERFPNSTQLAPPGRATIYRRAQAIDVYEKACAQEGKLAADRRFRIYGNGRQAAHPLALVQIDHTPLDVLAVSADMKVIGRPILTIAIDTYSRMVVGFHLSFEEASYVSVMHCLRMALLPKRAYLEQYRLVQGDWPCFGVPVTLLLDNGKEFHSKHLLESAAQLGINIDYCPVRMPHYKPIVERFFGTLNTKANHTLPGTTFSNTQNRGDYDSEKHACLTLEELRERLLIAIVDLYHHDIHSGINDLPLRKWQKGVVKHPPRIAPSINHVRTLTQCVHQSALTQSGITLEGLSYVSGDLQPLRDGLFNRMRVQSGSPEVKYRYDPDDLGEIHVLDEISGGYITVPCVDLDYADGLSMKRHKDIQKQIRDENKKWSDLSSSRRYEARRRMAEMLKEAIDRKRKITRKQAHAAGESNSQKPKSKKNATVKPGAFVNPLESISPEALKDAAKSQWAITTSTSE